MASISRTHCRDCLEVLRFLPANAAKLFPKLTPCQAADHARPREGIKVIGAANANTLISNLSSFLNWTVNEEMLTRNPARGLRLPDPVNKRDKRLPFAPEQLHAIFSGRVDGERSYNKVGDCRPRKAQKKGRGLRRPRPFLHSSREGKSDSPVRRLAASRCPRSGGRPWGSTSR